MQQIYSRFMVNSCDSWKLFEQIREFWKNKEEVLEEFGNFIKEKAELDRTYARGLERLAKASIFGKAFGRFGISLNIMQGSLTEVSMGLLSHCDYVEQEVYLEIKKINSEQETAVKEITEKIKGLVMERETFLRKNKNAKGKANKPGKEETSSAAKLSADQGQKEVNESMFNTQFKCEIAESVRNFKTKFEEKFELAKKSLSYLISSEANWVYGLKMHLDHLAKDFECIEFEEEVRFINSLFMQFLDVDKEIKPAEQTSEDQEHENKLREIIENCWNGIEVPKSSIDYFKSHISLANFRKSYTKLLNNQRRLRKFLVPQSTFKDLSSMFLFTLDSLAVNPDFSTTRQSIILSQTFHDNEKHFIQQFLTGHSIWTSEAFWEELLSDSINLDIFSSKPETQENSQEFISRARDIARATMISYIDIMVAFQRDSGLIYSVCTKCKLKFHLTDEDIDVSSVINLCKGNN